MNDRAYYKLKQEAEELVHILHRDLVDKYLSEIERNSYSYDDVGVEHSDQSMVDLGLIHFDPKGIESDVYISFELLQKIIQKYQDLDGELK